MSSYINATFTPRGFKPKHLPGATSFHCLIMKNISLAWQTGKTGAILSSKKLNVAVSFFPKEKEKYANDHSYKSPVPFHT